MRALEVEVACVCFNVRSRHQTLHNINPRPTLGPNPRPAPSAPHLTRGVYLPQSAPDPRPSGGLINLTHAPSTLISNNHSYQHFYTCFCQNNKTVKLSAHINQPVFSVGTSLQHAQLSHHGRNLGALALSSRQWCCDRPATNNARSCTSSGKGATSFYSARTSPHATSTSTNAESVGRHDHASSATSRPRTAACAGAAGAWPCSGIFELGRWLGWDDAWPSRIRQRRCVGIYDGQRHGGIAWQGSCYSSLFSFSRQVWSSFQIPREGKNSCRRAHHSLA